MDERNVLVKPNQVVWAIMHACYRLAMIGPHYKECAHYEAYTDTHEDVFCYDYNQGYDEWDKLTVSFVPGCSYDLDRRKFVANHQKDGCKASERDLVKDRWEYEYRKQQRDAVNERRGSGASSSIDISG